MTEIAIKKYVRYLFGVVFLIFILNKLYLRPWVIENELPLFFQIVVFSIPNLIEAIIGTLILTGILLHLRQYVKKAKHIKDATVYLLAVSACTLYVISQELKFHNLGGNNVYDPYDLIASGVGLLMTFIIISKFGFAAKEEV